MLCFKNLVISNFSHDLSFDLSTYDPFHQLLKEVKPLALSKILGRAMCSGSTFSWNPPHLTLGLRHELRPWRGYTRNWLGAESPDLGVDLRDLLSFEDILRKGWYYQDCPLNYEKNWQYKIYWSSGVNWPWMARNHNLIMAWNWRWIPSI